MREKIAFSGRSAAKGRRIDLDHIIRVTRQGRLTTASTIYLIIRSYVIWKAVALPTIPSQRFRRPDLGDLSIVRSGKGEGVEIDVPGSAISSAVIQGRS